MAEQPAGFEETIDWQRLQRVVLNMSHTFGKPVVFKSFLLAWHLEQMLQLMPKSIFLWIRRDPIDNAISLAKARETQLGSVEKWLSMKPREYDWLQHQPVPVQLAGQVYFTELAIARQVRRLAGRNVLEITHQEMCSQPRAIVERVQNLIRQNGHSVEQVAARPRVLIFHHANGRTSFI